MARVLALITLALWGTSQALVLGSEKPVSCDCLNFKDTYDAKLVKCGEGFENQEHGFCEEKHWFQQFNSSHCVKTNQHAMYVDGTNTWCYVAAGCERAWIVNDKISYKTCSLTGGERLADLPPRRLFEIFGHSGVLLLEPSLAVAMAYPVAAFGSGYADVASFFETGNVTGILAANGFDGVRQRLQQLVDSKVPTIICTVPGQQPGHHACEDPFSMHIIYGEEHWFVPQSGTPECLKGCAA